MSIRLEMLQVARLAPKLLGDSTELVDAFFRRQQLPDGGFKGRSQSSDLYYTTFALEGLVALHASPGNTIGDVGRQAGAYLESFADGAGLDFVHLCCLARARASLRQWESGSIGGSPLNATALLGRIEQFRSADGGFNVVAGSGLGTAYACFLALGAYQDLREEMPNSAGLAQCLQSLQTPDGAWTNEWRAPAPKPTVGSTNATAAAITVLRTLGQPIQPGAGCWLLACAHPQGGFLAAPQAPLPDLLSTATALHALAGLETSFDHLAEACLDFVDSLWTNEGGFYGHWPDEQVDCEYTYYALLALGHLSLCLVNIR